MDYLIRLKTPHRADIRPILNSTDDPFLKLACSIVLYAVVDYRNAVRYLKKYPENDGISIDIKHRKYLKECEQFFNSDWFILLCNEDIDGTKLAELIRRQEGWDGVYEL